MRRPWFLLALVLLACSSEDPPPGEVVGTFAFVATLDESGAPADGLPNCTFAGAPIRIQFDGTLSHDRATGAAWLQIDGTLREGTLEEEAFALHLPREPDGSIRAIPRTLDACDCELLFTEQYAGRLVKSTCLEPTAQTPLGPDTCPRIDEAGELSWDTCGALCGTLEERVRFEAGSACVCEVDGEQRPAPESGCAFVYTLQGTRIGG